MVLLRGASVVGIKDEFYPPMEDDGAKMEIRYEVKGRIVADKAVAMGCWTPDKVRDKCDEVANKFDLDEVYCDVDFVVEATGVKVKDLLTADKVAPLVQPGKVNIILCWTSFHENSSDALTALTKMYPTLSAYRVIGLVLDEQPNEARAIARRLKLPFECYWVGTNGWTSKAAKALSIEESAPTCYLFNDGGAYITSGALEDVLVDLKRSREDYDVNDETAASSLVPDEAWVRIRVLIASLNKQGSASLRATMRTVSTSSAPSVHNRLDQRVTLNGEMFPEARSQLADMLKALRKEYLSIRIGVDGVKSVTRPRPFAFNSSCSLCNGMDAKYGCLVCESNIALCSTCGERHETKHPLVVLNVKEHYLSKSLFGIGHVVFVKSSEGDDGSADAHPDIGCDSCLSALAATSKRYKNLARREHELCEKCFNDSVVFKGSQKAFTDKFACAPSDPFCEMKTSRNVAFTRLDTSETDGLGVVADEGQERKEAGSANESRSIPSGHTVFSWTAGGSAVPNGHSGFSWIG